VVTTAVYAFQGFTDPGCTVDVGGKYFADVDTDGAWTLDLVLRPGANTTTITAADKNGVKTAVQVTVTYAPIVLRSDGLGIVDLGDSIDEALTDLNGVLGPPTQTIEDSEAMLEPSRGQYGFGPDQTAIVAIWDDIGLLAAFSEYPFYRQDGAMHLSGWISVAPSTASNAPRTQEGIGVGSTFAEVHAAYGDRFIWGSGEEECGPWAALRFPNEEEGVDHITLWFGDLTQQSETELVGLAAGAGPGC
jgi:hypothetical protein